MKHQLLHVALVVLGMCHATIAVEQRQESLLAPDMADAATAYLSTITDWIMTLVRQPLPHPRTACCFPHPSIFTSHASRDTGAAANAVVSAFSAARAFSCSVAIIGWCR